MAHLLRHPRLGNRFLSLFVTPLLLAATIAQPIAAADNAVVGHVRTDNGDLERLVIEGTRRSPAFHALVDEIDRSDVFVYVEGQRLPSSLTGRLTFVGASVGASERWRYLRVQIDCRRMFLEQIAALGHELQHAVEIADAPAVVNSSTLRQLYLTMGITLDGSGTRFESDRARATGRRVYSELVSHTSDVVSSR